MICLWLQNVDSMHLIGLFKKYMIVSINQGNSVYSLRSRIEQYQRIAVDDMRYMTYLKKDIFYAS
jgi:hypothetical protein